MAAPERFAKSQILFPCTAGAVHTWHHETHGVPPGAYSLVSVLVGEDHAHRRWLGSAVEGDMTAYLVVEHTILDSSKFEEYRTKVGPLLEKHGGRYITRGGTHNTNLHGP